MTKVKVKVELGETQESSSFINGITAERQLFRRELKKLRDGGHHTKDRL